MTTQTDLSTAKTQKPNKERTTDNEHASINERAAWTIDEGAWRLSLGRTTIYKLHAAGKIKLIKIGRRRLIPNTEIIRISENGI